jgi:DNA-binding PadR family transcriptional regulator
VPDRTMEQAGPRQPPAEALTLKLSDIEVALLGLLSIRPMTGYEIRQSYARGLAPWWETPRTQIYPKLRELKQRGLVRDKLVVQDGKPNKRVYTIEPAGSEALVSWLRRDISWPDMKHQMMMRLFLGNLLPLPAFRQLLADYSERMTTLVDSLRAAHTRFSAALTGPYRTSVFFELLSLEHLIKMAELEVSGTKAILTVLARTDGAFTLDNGDQASQLLEAIREQAQSLLPAQRHPENLAGYSCWCCRCALRLDFSCRGGLSRRRFAGPPDFFARPLPGPVERDERVPGFCFWLRPELNEVFHLQAATPQQADHVAVAEVELHRLIIGPFEPVHAEVGPQQPLGGRLIIGVRDGEHEQHRVHQEDQLPAGAQQPGRLGDPRVGITPDARAVLRDGQVEAGVGEGCLLGAGVDQREPQPEPVLQLAGGGQLRRGVVQAGRPRAAAGQPGRDVPGAAAQLDAVPAGQLGGQHARLRLGDIPDTPRGLRRRPQA